MLEWGRWQRISSRASHRHHRVSGAMPLPQAVQKPPNRSSKADQVYEDIKEAILSGTFEPGAAIDKIALCERLGVSRFPVTTAVNRLAFERLVVIEPQHGSFVARISARDINDAMTLRRALEAEIAGLAAARLTPEVHAALERNLRYQRAAAEAKDFSGFHALDNEFHEIIVAGTQLAHAGEILFSLRAHVERVRRILLTPPGRMPVTLGEHRAIFAALKSRDAAAARAAMRQHLEQTTVWLADFAKQQPHLFNPESPAP